VVEVDVSLNPTWDQLDWGLGPQNADRCAEYLRRGLWTGESVGELLPRLSARWPWLPAVQQAGTALSMRDVLERVEYVAAELAAQGVIRGSIVCWQLPTWWEAYIANLAIWHLGAVSSPVVMIYREAELSQILGELQPTAVITCGIHRGTDHTELFEAAMRSAAVSPAVRVVVRGTAPGWTQFDQIPARGALPYTATAADDPCLVMFTSGTTSASKGVIHTSRSVLAEARQIVAERGVHWEDTTYVPTPLAHAAGMYLGIVVPVFTGARAILDDRWDGAQACRLIVDESVTFCVGATLFLDELTQAATAKGVRLAGLRNFACGGAAVPQAVMERAEAAGIPATRGYGMTELPTVTISNRSLPVHDRIMTDGPVADGVEVRLDAVPGFAHGEILVRGPERMAGYLRPGDSAASIDADGWFRTGDLGILDGSLLTVTGRVKEIINRGGEKFSAREVEELLASHAGVQLAAVVAAADQRFGEVPAAWVITNGKDVTEEALLRHLADAGLARQKSPVYWRFVETVPRTASGKVNRAALTKRINDEVAGAKAATRSQV
jgi:acyl-CoA synthetase (AMP-forming)/AMP-acid ligase II